MFGLGAHQRVDERLEHGAQQIRLGALEVLGQELGRVNTEVCGHRVVLLRRTLVGLLKDHAVAASHHDATLNNGATPYTTSVDSTSPEPPGNALQSLPMVVPRPARTPRVRRKNTLKDGPQLIRDHIGAQHDPMLGGQTSNP